MKIDKIFQQQLFWDTNIKTIDSRKHAAFIIERVLSRGLLVDWFALNRLYDAETIKNVAIAARYLDKKTMNFCSVFFEVPLKEFRCYNQEPSVKALWPF